MKWDTAHASERAIDYLLKKRSQSKICLICRKKEFELWKELEEWIFKYEVIKKKISPFQFEEIRNNVFEHFHICGYQSDCKLVRHHINYILDITIPLCHSCHSKVHNSNDKKYEKWKPYDKKPK